MGRSISRRIVVSLAVTTIIAGACEYGWLYMKARATAISLRERSLIDQAKVIAGYLVIDRNGNPSLQLPPRLAEGYDNSKSPYRYAIRNQYGNVIFTSGPSVAPLPLLNEHRQTIYDYDPDGPGPLRVFGAAVKTAIGGRSFFTQVEQTSKGSVFPSSAVTEEFVTDGGWLQLPFLLVLLGVSVIVVKGALRPLKTISRMAEVIDPAKPDVRLPTKNVPDEITPLVNAMNVALERLEDGLRRQRDFNANAAHQLRTPLAVLMANIDAMDDTETAATLRHDVEAMSRMVAQLLRLARVETLSIPVNQQVDLNEVATEVAANLAPLALALGKNLEVVSSRERAVVDGNAQALAAALSNLVENAVSHTPEGTAITVRVTSDPAIEVIDTGYGIPAEWRDRVFDRFWKADREGQGAGLGLAIVKRIVTALHGTVSVTDRPGGGAAFKISFSQQGAG